MLARIGVPVVATVMLFAGAAEAGRMPAIEAKGSNTTPSCVTPGRLMALLKARNPRLDQRFDKIAVEYMRHGEALGVRWDFAFFQMVVETGNLAYTGDVSADQNNFAGIGATGNGEPGERFASLADGVKAHLQHLQMYAGVRVDDPVAERTRKVQEWKILDSWRRRLRGAVTFDQMAGKWAPGSRGYPRDIASVGESFMEQFCGQPDPAPEQVAEARGETARRVAAAPAVNEPPSGAELARRAMERARAEQATSRASLGAGSIAAGLNVLNGAKPAPEATDDTRGGAPAGEDQAGAAQTACKVWTASYGGQKAVIIKAQSGALANYTVLDVNEGREGREVEAFISAYAKGGRKIADFSTQSQALEKAFELCPER